MSAQHASALPAATGAAVSRLAGERDVIEAARRVHRALGDTNRLEVVRRLAAGPATGSQLREAWGVSRKYGIPLCEYFDAQQLTLRAGDLRQAGPALVAPEPPG